MRALLVSALMLMPFTVEDQLADGKVLIEFNASFNKSNSYEALGRISGAKLYRIDIEAKPALKEKYNIKSVPTIIYFNDDQERYRWAAGIDMKLHVHHTEIQDVVNRY
jgi:hypothetical protein